MKFQKDNVNVALTQEMKDAAIKAEEDRINAIREKEEKEEKYRARLFELEVDYHQKIEAFERREYAYGPIAVQLDMLWHDMDNGIIKVDKRKKGSWYKHIKQIKDEFPLSENWKEEIEEAHKKLVEFKANRDI